MPRSPGHVFCDRLQKPLSEAGRIIAHLVARGAIGPVPICAAGRGHGASASQQSNATPPLAQGHQAKTPGRTRPDRARSSLTCDPMLPSSTSPPTIAWSKGRSAASPPNSAQPAPNRSSANSSPRLPSLYAAFRSMAEASSSLSSNSNARRGLVEQGSMLLRSGPCARRAASKAGCCDGIIRSRHPSLIEVANAEI
jgi:hypothetical protein